MVAVTIRPAKKSIGLAKGLPTTFDCSANTTVAELKKLIKEKYPKFSTSRQKLSKGPSGNLDDDKKIGEIFTEKGEVTELFVKDLGPQVGWRTVFLIEYAGPMLIHPIFYYFPKLWYGKDFVHSDVQKLVYALVMIHFAKREFETLFIHRFSHGTMPFMNIFRNSAHYWFLSGVLLAFDVYRTKFSAASPYIVGTIRNDPRFLYACTAFWAFAEFSNLNAHLVLRNLRPAGTRKRGIPYGWGFSSVSCANYWFETLAWLTICVMTGSIASVIFLLFAFVTMAIWAKKKHRNYKKEFGKEYPKGRTAIVPFLY